MDSSISIVTTFWQQYLNSEEKFITFYISFSIYASLALYCRFILQQPKAFSDWQEVHHSHNVIGLILAVLSICMDNDDIMKERTIIEFTYGYFLVDCIDVILNRDWPYVIHATAVLAIGAINWSRPLHRQLRFHSKAYMCELSSPPLHRAKRTRKPLDFIVFALTFTACRILWLPIIIYQAYQAMNGFHLTSDPLMACLFGFYALQLFWWYKIIRIILSGGEKKKKNDGDKKDSPTQTESVSSSSEYDGKNAKKIN